MVSLFDFIAILISKFILDIIIAKFNCTVPGTLSDLSDECNITMKTTSSTTSPTMTTNSVVTTAMVTEFDYSLNPDIFSIVLTVLVGGIMIFTLCITIVCSVFVLQRIKQKRQSHTFSEGQVVMQENLTTNALQHLEEEQQNHYGIYKWSFTSYV